MPKTMNARNPARALRGTDLTNPPSLFDAFVASRRLCMDIGKALNADMGREDRTVGFMYDHGCYIEIQDDGRFYLIIERSDWIDSDLDKLERILWAMHYLEESAGLQPLAESTIMLSAHNGDLDTYIVGVCAFYNVPVDGDAFGLIFSGEDEWPLDEVAVEMQSYIVAQRKG